MKAFLLSSIIALMMSMGIVSLQASSVSAAAPAPPAPASSCDQSAGFLGFPTWYKYLPVGVDASGHCNINLAKEPGTDRTDFKFAGTRILLAVFEIMLRVAGILAIVFVMWGGIKYQLSQGAPDEVEKARSTILNALIGLALTISATVIVNLVGSHL